MAYEARDNSGALFKVPDEKRSSETWPQYEGDFKIACPHCNATLLGWTKAWVKEGKMGKFFSLAFKHKTTGGN